MIPSDVKDFLLKASKHYMIHENQNIVGLMMHSGSMPNYLQLQIISNKDKYIQVLEWLEQQEVEP